MAKCKHDWNSWEHYLSIHEQILKKYIQLYYVSGPQAYKVEKLTDQHIDLIIHGLVLSSEKGGHIEFKIEKTVELDISFKRPRARTFAYSYHALTPKPAALNVIRYCSAHDHRPYHHKHVYKADGTYSILKVPEDTHPHVSEFFDEVLKLY